MMGLQPFTGRSPLLDRSSMKEQCTATATALASAYASRAAALATSQPFTLLEHSNLEPCCVELKVTEFSR